MTAIDLINKLIQVPPTAKVILFNSSCEWYGIEELNTDAVAIINNEVVISFSNDKISLEDIQCLTQKT
jgi:hypothetical protein